MLLCFKLILWMTNLWYYHIDCLIWLNAMITSKSPHNHASAKVRIIEAIMDAPETAAGLDLVKQRARDAGFKAGYNRCISHLNVMSIGGEIEERSGFRDTDTESLLQAAEVSFYDTSLACVEELDNCLEAADYVDRLRMLYPDAEEEEPAGGAGGDAGTSGTK
ncbi:hypothetical protein HanLR1_Chr12g0464891 [Helianthus annuus]|nr:hypothetical protein HanHA89_Chr12g0488311 [Helianthus annuus]KAJ0676628.1 hypothetical protein HanLR1_Chr12g0464891 [Helianthus annuus]